MAKGYDLMFWIILFLLGVMVAVVYAVVWLALMAFLGLASLVLVIVHALAVGVRDQREEEARTRQPVAQRRPEVGGSQFQAGTRRATNVTSPSEAQGDGRRRRLHQFGRCMRS